MYNISYVHGGGGGGGLYKRIFTLFDISTLFYMSCCCGGGGLYKNIYSFGLSPFYRLVAAAAHYTSIFTVVVAVQHYISIFTLFGDSPSF